MPPEPMFPPGLTIRGATYADIPTVAALLRASESFDAGEPSAIVEDVESEWMIPDFDSAVDVLLVFEDDRAVASAEVPGWRAEATVHPDARGRGIGTAILEWTERRAVERANDSAFGLGGSVWTNDWQKGADIARRLQVGTAWINQHAALEPGIPSGGAKESGIGVEYSRWGLLEYTVPQVVNAICDMP